jgi:hypothetical protein
MLFAEQLEPGQFRIVDLSMDLSSGSHAHFIRDPTTHNDALRAFLERAGGEFSRFNYLGEWHSHPAFTVEPSREDVATMTDLVNEDNAIEFAVLLVVRLRLHFWLDYSLTAFARGLPGQTIVGGRSGWVGRTNRCLVVLR